jgi:chaperonin cofactor prefoldin
MKNDTLNKKMWPIHKMCFDCVITMETKLKREGKFEEYERNMTKKGIETYIKELEEALLELSLSTSDESIVTESGDIEHWVGGNIDKQKILQDLQEHIQKLKDIVGY